jgi:hypothetical protein
MAMGRERPHPQLLGQGEGFPIVGFGSSTCWRVAPRLEPAEEAQGVRLMAPLLVRTGERQCALGVGERLIQMTGERLGLPEWETTKGLEVGSSHRHALLEHLREQQYGVGDTPG